MEKLIVSSSPHIHSGASTQRIMLDVVIALLPASVAAVVLFGLKALLMIAVSVSTAVISEFLFNLIDKKKQTVGDLSAVITGLLLALNLPTTTTVWQIIVGAVFAIVVVKCLFGGIGCNFANPAITARIMLLSAFTEVRAVAHTSFEAADIVSGATPLGVMGGEKGTLPELLDMLLGVRGGAIGETCAIALILGGLYLVARRVIHWQTPVVFVGTVFVLSLILGGFDVTYATYQILAGGLLIGAIFMATDYSTTPTNTMGKVIFAFGCGVITVIIRFYASYPEGVSFAILIMNILSPYIEKLGARRPFGKVGK